MKAIKNIIITLCVIVVYLVTAIPWIEPLVYLPEDASINRWTFGISIIECVILTAITMLAMERFGKWFNSKLKQDEEKS